MGKQKRSVAAEELNGERRASAPRTCEQQLLDSSCCYKPSPETVAAHSAHVRLRHEDMRVKLVGHVRAGSCDAPAVEHLPVGAAHAQCRGCGAAFSNLAAVIQHNQNALKPSTASAAAGRPCAARTAAQAVALLDDSAAVTEAHVAQLETELGANARARAAQAAEATGAFLEATTRFSSGTRGRGVELTTVARNSDAPEADLKALVACMQVSRP
jgi:hypothetical protein